MSSELGSVRRVVLGPVQFLPKSTFVVVPLIPAHRLPDGTRARSALVGWAAGRWVAYANTCRHLAIPLDLEPGEVMDHEGTHLQCHHHGAIYEPETGLCVSGPCQGKRLWGLAIEISDAEGAVLVLDP